jgi:hypothetical protein
VSDEQIAAEVAAFEEAKAKRQQVLENSSNHTDDLSSGWLYPHEAAEYRKYGREMNKHAREIARLRNSQ